MAKRKLLDVMQFVQDDKSVTIYFYTDRTITCGASPIHLSIGDLVKVIAKIKDLCQ